MAKTTPATMRSLAIGKFCKPEDYEVMELPVPAIKNPGHVLVRVHAANITTGDTQYAGGMFRFFESAEYVPTLETFDEADQLINPSRVPDSLSNSAFPGLVSSSTLAATSPHSRSAMPSTVLFSSTGIRD